MRRQDDDQQSGFASNWYSYQPLIDNDKVTDDTLGTIGKAIGDAVAEQIPNQKWSTLSKAVLPQVGSAGLQQLGYLINNSSRISNNVQTFIKEMNDTRSWDNAINVWSHSLPFEDQ